MDEARRSSTAESAAIFRVLHQTLDGDPIFEDPIAPLLVDALRLESLAKSPVSPGYRAMFAVRTRYAEDRLAASLDRGVRQYVMLGAGFDTFAYRQPAWANSLQVFEVDHPASQRWKKERLVTAGVSIPANLRFAPVDFERTSLKEGLSAASFDFGCVSFFSWLGVTVYLTIEAIEKTLGFVLSLARKSEIVFSFIVPDELLPADEATFFAMSAASAASAGEPWLTRPRPDELKTKLSAMGFSKVVHLTPEESYRRYFSGRRDGLVSPSASQMISAVV